MKAYIHARLIINLVAITVFASYGARLSAAAAVDDGLALTKAGKPACTVVAITGVKPELLMQRAVESITGTVTRWGGVDLPVVRLNEGARDLPAGRAIVLTTLERLRKVAHDVEISNDAVKRVAFLDEQGFAIVPVQSKEVTRLFVVGRTARGVFNGAVYLRDFHIEGTKEDLYVQLQTAVRSPQMGGRPVYLLTIWNNESEYAAGDWEKIFDSFARDGMDRIYFWLSGHFPSKKFPQTYKIDNEGNDSTERSRIGTVEDQRRIIRYAHDMGLKFYIGGALGGWVGTRFLTNLQPDTIKRGPGERRFSLCPSHPQVRQNLIEYYKEMFDALPEADGVFIESADEAGDCECPICSKPVDDFGSKQFGQSQLTLIQKIMRAIRQDHPHARLAYTIGYSQHKQDPAYYEMVRQMSDPRIEWMEARNTWEFPGPRGKALPASYFSRQVMSWKYDDMRPLEKLIEDINRAGTSGFYGSIATFSPGFSSGSFYKQIPFPTDILPYVLTYFLHREATWEPSLTVEEARRRIQKRFFGDGAPEVLGKDFWTLREMIRTSSSKKTTVETKQQLLAQVEEIEQHVSHARAGGSPKTQEGLHIMQRAIDDIRKHISSK